MPTKTELIEKQREDIDLLIQTNEDLVKQMSALLKRETEMEKRLDTLGRKYERLLEKVNGHTRKVGVPRR